MEKKQYVSPETEAIKIETSSVLCESGGAGGGSQPGGGDPLTSFFPFYYDPYQDPYQAPHESY
ncbi:MAG: hypothetical protein IKN88_03470 [Bacteroidales bacterium]|nr:hypothetical protein [Bacteroidales bacterium]